MFNSNRKKLVGKVVSAKCSKTRIASIQRLVSHKLYGGFVRMKKRIMFHDDKNESGINDIVQIVETKPISARKRWTLLKIVQKNILNENN